MTTPKRTLVLLANTTARQVWMGEAAMRGDTVYANKMRVVSKTGDVFCGVFIGDIEQGAVKGWHLPALQWVDEVDLTRCHPLPSPRLQQELDILLAAGKIYREREAAK